MSLLCARKVGTKRCQKICTEMFGISEVATYGKCTHRFRMRSKLQDSLSFEISETNGATDATKSIRHCRRARSVRNKMRLTLNRKHVEDTCNLLGGSVNDQQGNSKPEPRSGMSKVHVHAVTVTM